MKKLLFTLLTAACFAGAASAVSKSWTEVTTDTPMPTKFTSSFSIGVVFTVDNVTDFLASTNLDVLIGVAYANASSDPYANSGDLGSGPSFIVGTDGKLYGKAKYNDIGQAGNESWYKAETSNLKVGENAACLTVSFTGSSATYTFYINGEKLYTQTHGSIGTDYQSFNWIDTLDSADEVYYMTSVADLEKDINTLPEPTALALLALGAAGLALRRKAA